MVTSLVKNLNLLMMMFFSKLLAKHRSFRGSLTSKIKDAMHRVFPNLPPVNTNSTPSEINNWKTNPEVARCHKILFQSDSPDGSATFMSKIIDKVWPTKKKAPKVHIAYAISVCEFILNPKNKKIQISEFSIKHKISKYLNKLVNKERISNSDDEQEKGQVIEDKRGQEEGDQEGDQEEDQEGDQEGDKEGREKEEMNEVEGGVDDYYSSEEERRLFESEEMKKYKKNKY